MKHFLKEKMAETLWAVIPLFAVVIAINFILLLILGKSVPSGVLIQFIIGTVFLLLGLFFLSIGEDLAMIRMGDQIGSHITGTGKYLILIICCFLMGALVTFAEPNLTIFADLHPGISNRTIIISASVGVGVFLVISVLRVIKKIPIQITLAVAYTIVLIAAFFVPKELISSAFDSGGVATGPVTASFIMSLGFGLAAVRGGRDSVSDSFGSVGLCIIGPVLALLLLGAFGVGGEIASEYPLAYSPKGAAVILDFINEIPVFLEEVSFAVLPIVLFFIVFQFIFLHLGVQSLVKTGVGIASVFIGHTLFLTGAFVGFLPAGYHLGFLLGSLPNGLNYLLIPFGMVMGGLIVQAEPAIHVLADRVETATIGKVKKGTMRAVATLGVSLAVGISMLRILTGIPVVYFLIGGYAFSLILSFIVPRIFTAVAFDSGGAATGAMAVAFILPLTKGACMSVSAESILTDAFGVVALMVLMPVVTIQFIGLLYRIRIGRDRSSYRADETEVSIIEFDTEIIE